MDLNYWTPKSNPPLSPRPAADAVDVFTACSLAGVVLVSVAVWIYVDRGKFWAGGMVCCGCASIPIATLIVVMGRTALYFTSQPAAELRAMGRRRRERARAVTITCGTFHGLACAAAYAGLLLLASSSALPSIEWLPAVLVIVILCMPGILGGISAVVIFQWETNAIR